MALRADVKLGFACNNRCVFCAQGEKRKHIRTVPADEVLARMKAAFRPGSGLVLTGGEPTIRRDLPDLVRHARAIGYRPIQVQTNGRMLAYEALVDRLVRAGVEEFSPALHGPGAEVHDALTKAPGSFEETVRGIRNVVASPAYVVTNTVVVAGNLAHLDATLSLLFELGVRHAQLALVHPVGTAQPAEVEVVPHIGPAAEAIARAVRHGRALGMKIVVEAVPPCLLPGVEDAVVEDQIPDTTVVDLDGSPFGFSDWRRVEGKAKGPPCERCALSARCEGPWREYPERDGWDAYRPIATPITGDSPRSR